MGDLSGFSLRDGMDLAGIGLDELWWRYAAIGGGADVASLAMCVLEAGPCERREHDLIAQALNEAFVDRGHDTFPIAYASPPPPVLRRVMSSASTSRSLEARRQAALARLRSAAAARQAAGLHATAAQLMLASGRLQYAHSAKMRARAAERRAAHAAAA